MPEGYYLYRHRFRFETRDGTRLGEAVLPSGTPKTDEFFGDVEVFYDTLTARVPVVEPAGDRFEVGIEYQGCADYGLCYPPERKWLQFAAAASGTGDTGASGWAFAELIATLGAALLGGLILNLMPCVFPVLSIKALSLLGDPAGRVRDAAGFSVGVVATFASLGLLLVALRGAGEAVGWGFQLQSPGFVTGMAMLFFALGLNLLGVLPTPPFGVAVDRGGPVATGVLAVVVATPCTVPFMGAAVGYGLSQPAPVLLAVMVALGVGMALPYVLLAAVPPIARRLPRPGAWMVTLKQVMAFPMFVTVVWLVWVLVQQSGAEGRCMGACGVRRRGVPRVARHAPSSGVADGLARDTRRCRARRLDGSAAGGGAARRQGRLRHAGRRGAPGIRRPRVSELHRVLVHHLPRQRAVDARYRSHPCVLRGTRHRVRQGRLDQCGPGDRRGSRTVRA